jgi:hypothetical protein
MNGFEWLPDVTRGLLMAGTLLLALGVHLESKKLRERVEDLKDTIYFFERDMREEIKDIAKDVESMKEKVA